MTPGDDRSDEADLLEQILSSGRDSGPPKADRTIDGLVREALKGTPRTRPEVSAAIEKAIGSVENEIARQLREIIRHRDFQVLESSWRGVFDLVRRVDSDSFQKLRLFDLSTTELIDDLGSALRIEDTALGRKLSALLDGEDDEPFTVLLDDHDLSGQVDQVSALQRLASLGLAGQTLVVATASPSLCGLQRWSELNDDDVNLGAGLLTDQTRAFKVFRESEAAQAMILAVPRILARMPYGPDSCPVEEFPFDELADEPRSTASALTDRLPWMGAVYVLGAMIAERFADESANQDEELSEIGARVGRLNSFFVRDEDGDLMPVGPAELAVGRRREADLREWGLAPLLQSRDGDTLVLNRFQTLYLRESK